MNALSSCPLLQNLANTSAFLAALQGSRCLGHNEHLKARWGGVEVAVRAVDAGVAALINAQGGRGGGDRGGELLETYRRTGHDNMHVRGYKEEGTTTTPFDRCWINDLDRFHLVSDVIDRVPKLGERAAYAKQEIRDKLIDHREYIRRYGDDMPEIKNWTWAGQGAAGGAASTEGDNV